MKPSAPWSAIAQTFMTPPSSSSTRSLARRLFRHVILLTNAFQCSTPKSRSATWKRKLNQIQQILNNISRGPPIEASKSREKHISNIVPNLPVCQGRPITLFLTSPFHIALLLDHASGSAPVVLVDSSDAMIYSAFSRLPTNPVGMTCLCTQPMQPHLIGPLRNPSYAVTGTSETYRHIAKGSRSSFLCCSRSFFDLCRRWFAATRSA